MKKSLLTLLALSQASTAAVSLLIEPGLDGHSRWTLTQTSPSPELNIAGISGYSMGMSLPQSMFNYAYADGETPLTTVTATLSGILATVTEVYGGPSFQLGNLVISYGSSTGPSYLAFNSLWTIGGQGAARFDIISTAIVEPVFGIGFFVPGVHTVQDTLFGAVTVTVIPEPAACLLTGLGGAGSLLRRRRAIS